jgi:hypothetical protein
MLFPASGNNHCITLPYFLIAKVLLFYQLAGAFFSPYQNGITDKPVRRDHINTCKPGLKVARGIDMGASMCAHEHHFRVVAVTVKLEPLNKTWLG